MPRPLNPDSGRYDLKAEPVQLRLWAKAAELEGVELASWIRKTLNAAAKRALDKAADEQRKGRRM
jgi:predicted HicB family RNase H-like nuclease